MPPWLSLPQLLLLSTWHGLCEAIHRALEVCHNRPPTQLESLVRCARLPFTPAALPSPIQPQPRSSSPGPHSPHSLHPPHLHTTAQLRNPY